MTGKSDFTEQEWDTVLKGPPAAGLIVASASRGGTFKESFAIAKSYGEARQQHGASELLDAIASAKPEVDHHFYHSVDDVKAAGLKHVRDAIEVLEQQGDARRGQRLPPVRAHAVRPRRQRPPGARGGGERRRAGGDRGHHDRARRGRQLGRGPVQRHVAVEAAAGESLRAPALRVEVGELAGDRAEIAPESVVEHPRLDRDAAALRPQHAERAGLLGVVDQRRRADQPVAGAAARSGCGGCGRTARRSRAGGRRAATAARRRPRSSPAADVRRRLPNALPPPPGRAGWLASQAGRGGRGRPSRRHGAPGRARSGVSSVRRPRDSRDLGARWRAFPVRRVGRQRVVR